MHHKTLNDIQYPELLNHHIMAQTVELTFRIPPDLAYLEGHFDEAPLVPGVVQLHWAAIYSKKHLNLGATTEELAIQQVSQLKFSQPIRPNNVIVLLLTHVPEKNSISFSYKMKDSNILCSSGRISYASPALKEGNVHDL